MPDARPLPKIPTPDAAWRELHHAASEPYRQAGQLSWHFVRGRLGRDPVFRMLAERGLLGGGAVRLLDIGCGQGLLASLAEAMRVQQAAGRWPAAWPPAPDAPDYTGIESAPREAEHAAAAVGALALRPRLVRGDMRETVFPPSDRVILFDALHYVDLPAQEAVLARARDALAPGGRLLLRVGDAACRRGFTVSQWVDRTVTRVRGQTVAPTWGRPLADWVALLQGLGFAVEPLPTGRSPPLASVLLVADRPGPHAARAAAAP